MEETGLRYRSNFWIIGVFFILSFVGCVTSESVNDHSLVEDYEQLSYPQVLARYTRESSVFNKFETRALIKATFLSQQFQIGFDKHVRKVMGGRSFSIGETEGKTAFFVSIFVPTRKMMALKNPDYWHLSLLVDGVETSPSSITKLTDKYKWKGYFDYITRWSEEYFVVFDVPSHSLNQDQLLKRMATELRIMGPVANISLKW